MSELRENQQQLNDTEDLARRFNNAAILDDSIVRLRVTDHGVGTPTFQLVYDVEEDNLIQTKYYEDGCAIIYASDTAYDRINTIAEDLGGSVVWNNTRTIGWLK